MRPYLDLLRHVLDNGVDRDDRTGTGTRGVFGCQLRFDLARGFPLLTTKRLNVAGIVHELLWMLAGDTNVHRLHEHGLHIWDAWADQDGDLGPVYGAQWRRWPVRSDAAPGAASDGIDQIARVIEEIQTNPTSRRLLVSAWNVADLDRMALPPCHTLHQFHVTGGRLSCQIYQRSADLFVGLPWNIASYALLTAMVAQVCDLESGELVHTLGDVHLYRNHLDLARRQLERYPNPLPTLRLNPTVRSIFDFTAADVAVTGYRAHPHIRARVAV